MRLFTELQTKIHEWAVSKEWRGEKADPRTFGDDMALLVSEVSETLEAYRDSGTVNLSWYTYTVIWRGVKFKNMSREQLEVMGFSHEDIMELNPKPEGVGPELADVMIRLLDVAQHNGLDMDYEVERKMAHNEGREIRHGGKYL